jgi:hypothetical protein
MKFASALPFVLFLGICPALVCAEGLLPGLSSVTEVDARDSALAFVNMATSPGLEGAVISVDNAQRTSDQWRSSLGFNAEVTLKDHIYNGYWGLALVGGQLVDKSRLIDDTGQPVQLKLVRDVAAIRGAFGLSFPMTQHLKLRPFLSLVVSDLRSSSTFDDTYVTKFQLPSNNFNTSARMWSVVASLDMEYIRWFGDYQATLLGQYNHIYTESFSQNSDALETIDNNNTVVIKGKYSGPTDLAMHGKPWRWNGYAIYTNFLTHNKVSLGYQSLIEVGAGMDWQLNIKPLDWFGWQYLGFKAGVILGDNVTGYSVGLTAQ